MFIRAEIKEAVWRFRDALAGVFVSVLGLYWAINSIGFMSILGTSLAIAGALVMFAGIQRGRFRAGADGAGVVHVDEGQVTYYGPIDGGSIVIANLDRLELDPTVKPAAEWVLHDIDAGTLRIPTNAEGASDLFDVFAGLDGIEVEPMLAKLNSGAREQVVIWRADNVGTALTSV